MADAPVTECEQEVEVARAKLASDLAMLRSPSTYNAFTDDLKREKDALVDKARSAAQSTLSNVVEDIKARAAANPAATIAIGAGIAWRLARNPPIATALVGIGLFSLLRTQASPTNGRGFFESGAQNLREQARKLASTTATTASDTGRVMSEKAADMVDVAKTKVAELTEAASNKAEQLADKARNAVSGSDGPASAPKMMDRQTPGFTHAEVGYLTTVGEAEGVTAPPDVLHGAREFLQDNESRDKVLLGAAALAVTTALGMALQRRNTIDELAD
jgi:ElaB/YqjD/DUF883 family membrane-anchored ribosome-binding protein